MDLTMVDIRLVLINHPQGNHPVLIRCRESTHDDQRCSLAVYANGMTCFGCGFRIDRRMEAMAYLLFHDQTRWRDAIKVAHQYAQGTSQEREREEEDQGSRKPLPLCLAALYYDNLLRNREASYRDLRKLRGLTPTSVYRFCIGHDGARFTIPVYSKENTLLSMRYRCDERYAMGEDRAKYSGLSGYNGTFLYPAYELSWHTGDTVAVVEGEFDAIRAWQAGIPTATVTNGAGSMSKLPTLLYETCPWVKKLVMIGDMDGPGRAASTKTREAARAMGYHTSMLSWDLADGKDITEYCLRNNEARLKALWKQQSEMLQETLPLASTS